MERFKACVIVTCWLHLEVHILKMASFRYRTWSRLTEMFKNKKKNQNKLTKYKNKKNPTTQTPIADVSMNKA